MMAARSRSSDEVILYNKYGIIVDKNNKQVVMRTEASQLVNEFKTKAHLMEFCTIEHYIGRVIND